MRASLLEFHFVKVKMYLQGKWKSCRYCSRLWKAQGDNLRSLLYFPLFSDLVFPRPLEGSAYIVVGLFVCRWHSFTVSLTLYHPCQCWFRLGCYPRCAVWTWAKHRLVKSVLPYLENWSRFFEPTEYGTVSAVTRVAEYSAFLITITVHLFSAHCGTLMKWHGTTLPVTNTNKKP